ncbi:hypothetical protein HYZ41_03920 [archaeon]|nr:hypothetical protein [archaeon]
MRIVLDANIFISAFLRDSKTRELLLSTDLELISPVWLVDETMKGAKRLGDKELVELGRKLKKGRFKELKKQGLV